MSQDFSHIPIIDVSALVTGTDGRYDVAAHIGKACRESAFFYIVGHGVPRPSRSACRI
jgi:isopenicillin N synthase-like dioxygenase